MGEGLKGDPRFFALLQQLAELHAKKAADYGQDQDIFANIRASQEFGVEPWRGALVRLNDKVTRLKTFCIKGTLANEGVEDSLMDLAAYSLISLILFKESQNESVSIPPAIGPPINNFESPVSTFPILRFGTPEPIARNSDEVINSTIDG